MTRELQDHYFRQAKRDGYFSRAAYKLIEIDDRKRLLHRGDCVLDCGAAPGSWLQVASQRVGPGGLVVGIDLQSARTPLPENVRFIQGDFTEAQPASLLRLISTRGESDEAPRRFDVVLSDMAPSTTGDPAGDHFRSVRLCEAVLDRCSELLRPGGKLAIKVFEGEAYRGLLQTTQRQFDSVKGFKPAASRSESTEIYIVAAGYRRPESEQNQFRVSEAAAPLPPRPTGWR